MIISISMLSVEKASVSFLLQTETVTLIFDLKLHLSVFTCKLFYISRKGWRCIKYIWAEYVKDDYQDVVAAEDNIELISQLDISQLMPVSQ